jgi:hypothetical protein
MPIRPSRGDSLRWPRNTLYPLKLALTSPRSGGRSVDIFRWRTKAPEFLFLSVYDSVQLFSPIFQILLYCLLISGCKDVDKLQSVPVSNF